MEKQSTSPTTFGTWARSLELIKQNPGLWLKTGALGVFAPYMLFILFTGWQSEGAASLLKSISIDGYKELLAPAASYLTSFLFAALFLAVVLLAGFFSFIHIGVTEFQDKETSPKQALMNGLSHTFPGGLFILLVFGLLSVEQSIIGPFRVLTLFASMACVIKVVDRRKTLTALKHAFLFKYSAPTHGGGMASAFVLIGLSALVFTGEYGLRHLYQLILFADELFGLSRGIWSSILPGLPFGPVYVIANVLLGLGISGLIAMIASYLVCLFYGVRSSLPMYPN